MKSRIGVSSYTKKSCLRAVPLLGLFLQEAELQVIKTFTQNPGPSRGRSLRKGMAGLLAASLIMSVTSVAHADVFGGSAAPANAQTTALEQRLAALEKELKELKEKNAQGASAGPGALVSGKSAAPVKPKPKMTPPPGLEDLPEGGNERELLLVEKELTHEVVGTINDMLIVRDGERRFVLSQDEFKAFEKKKRQEVIRKAKVEAVTESGARLNFPQLTPPPPPPVLEGSELNQAGQVVNQARAIEANGGQLPPPKPAPALPAPAGQNKPATPATPASPAKKN